MEPLINQYARENHLEEVNLHLGCGGQYLDGWINVDNFDYENNDSSRSGSRFDLKMDIRHLDVANDSVDKMLLVHVIEHFVRWEAVKLLQAFYCKLKYSGTLIMEHPDLDGWFLVGLWPLFAERGSMPLWEDAALNNGLVTIAFDTLPVQLEFMQDGYLQGLVGQKYWGWGYDTVQMIYDYIVEGAEYDDWTDSGMDIVTECNVDVMAEIAAS